MIPDESGVNRRGMRLWELVALAAGGVLGSGWLNALTKFKSFPEALLTWAVGGLMMMAFAVVVVELGIADPKTGGLIFHPLKACGPLVGTVVAGALWVAYAINPAAQSLSVVGTISEGIFLEREMSWPWLVLAALLMAGVFLLNLLPFRRLLALTVGLTAVKVLVLVVVVVAIVVEHAPAADFSTELGGGHLVETLGKVPQGLFGAFVIFSYLGFQAPVDFAGDVQGDRAQVARTIRRAVYGTIAGSFVLYAALQFAFFLLPGRPNTAGTFVNAVGSSGWLHFLVLVAAIVAPLGSAIVFGLALTREVAALSRAHLLHRGLQSAKFSRIPPWGSRRAGRPGVSEGRYDVYWLITLVNLGVALVFAALAVGVGTRLGSLPTDSLKGLNTVAILLLYTMSGVVLAVHRERKIKLLSGFVFVLTALIVVTTGIVDDKPNPWLTSVSAHLVGGVVVTCLAALIMLGVPWLAERDLPVVGRVLEGLDARNHLSRRGAGAWLGEPSVPPFVWLVAYLVLMGVGVGVGGQNSTGVNIVAVGVVSCGSLVLFVLLTRSSRRYSDAPDRESG